MSIIPFLIIFNSEEVASIIVDGCKLFFITPASKAISTLFKIFLLILEKSEVGISPSRLAEGAIIGEPNLFIISEIIGQEVCLIAIVSKFETKGLIKKLFLKIIERGPGQYLSISFKATAETEETSG